jgi:type II secretory pathway pseudopilin PulG
MRLLVKTERAHSLLEVLFAVTLLLLTTLALVLVLGSGLQMSAAGQERVKATEIAGEMLESIRQQGYLAIPSASLTFDSRLDDPPLDGFPPQPYPYRTDASAFRLEVSTKQMAPNLRSVRVTVHSPTATTRLESYFHP